MKSTASKKKIPNLHAVETRTEDVKREAAQQDVVQAVNELRAALDQLREVRQLVDEGTGIGTSGNRRLPDGLVDYDQLISVRLHAHDAIGSAELSISSAIADIEFAVKGA